MKKKSFWLIVLLHLGYWLLTGTQPLYMFIVFRLLNPSQVGYIRWVSSIIAPAVFYTFYFFLFPYLKRRQIIKFITYSGVSLIVTVAIGFVIFKHFIGYEVLNTNVILSMLLLYFPLRFIGSALMACLLKGFITWFAEIRYKQQLEKKNKETNLALLKAQINPHFLFNTLNNIDVLIEKDPATASIYLKKLSDILRFTLYESPSETIPLDKEAGYINQYIELQRIRTSNPDFVSFDIKGDTQNVQIAPMLFISFIENAFKHSTNKKLNKAIAISINSTENTLTFNCSNAYDDDAATTHEKSGLGLGLIRSRLELLYPNNYQLDINKTADRFTVNLTVDLA